MFTLFKPIEVKSVTYLTFRDLFSAAVIDAYPNRNFLDGFEYFQYIGPNDFFVVQDYAELEDAVQDVLLGVVVFHGSWNRFFVFIPLKSRRCPVGENPSQDNVVAKQLPVVLVHDNRI